MKTKATYLIKMVLDFLMALAFAALFSKKVPGGLTFHEYAGLAVGGAVVLHGLLNKGWIVGVTKKLFSRGLPARTRIAYVVDLLLAAALVTILVTGILISKVIFPNTAGVSAEAEVLHKAVSYLALLLLGVHLGLTWNKVTSMLKRLLRIGKTRIPGLVAVIAALAVFAAGADQMISTGYFDRVTALFTGYSETGEYGGHGTLQFSGGQADVTTSATVNTGAESAGLSYTEGKGNGKHGGGNGAGQAGGGTFSDLLATIYQSLSILGAFAVAAYYTDKLFWRIGRRRAARA